MKKFKPMWQCSNFYLANKVCLAESQYNNNKENYLQEQGITSKPYFQGSNEYI